MHGIKPRTLSNEELLRYGAYLAAEGPLPTEWAAELLRRLNYYTAGLEKHNASSIDPRQIPLPL